MRRFIPRPPQPPRYPVPTRHDVPTLWERAKAMFAVMRETITCAATLAQRTLVTHRERRHLLARLVPVEKIVRTLLMIEAATFLLMTPEGQRLRRETPIVEPKPPPPVGVAKPAQSIRILLPGWQTIAAYHPRIDPRVAEREAREREEKKTQEDLARRLAGLEALTAPAALEDPRGWRCRFTVLRWIHPERPPAPPPPPRRTVGIYSDTNFPIVPGMTIVKPPPRKPPADAGSDHGAMDLARRIEALSRVLANPAPAIRRVARRFAAAPIDTLDAPDMDIGATRRWKHGQPEFVNAGILADCPLRYLARARQLDAGQTAARKHDPG